MRALLLGLVSFALSGCLVTSVNPITPLEQGVMDERILGTWVAEDEAEGEKGYLHIRRVGSTRQLEVSMETVRADGSSESELIFAHVSRLGKDYYVSVKSQEGESGPEVFMFVKYVITDDGALRVALMNQEPVEQAVGEGRLAGEIKRGKWTTDVLLTASSSQLAAFIEANDGVLFTEFESHRRVETPHD